MVIATLLRKVFLYKMYNFRHPSVTNSPCILLLKSAKRRLKSLYKIESKREKEKDFICFKEHKFFYLAKR